MDSIIDISVYIFWPDADILFGDSTYICRASCTFEND